MNIMVDQESCPTPRRCGYRDYGLAAVGRDVAASKWRCLTTVGVQLAWQYRLGCRVLVTSTPVSVSEGKAHGLSPVVGLWERRWVVDSARLRRVSPVPSTSWWPLSLYRQCRGAFPNERADASGRSSTAPDLQKKMLTLTFTPVHCGGC